MQQEVDAELERLFEEFDRTQERGVLVSIRGLLNRRRYIRNLISQVEQELAVANTG
jgi:hypothetical protein